jgi:tricorn protease-like protein
VLSTDGKYIAFVDSGKLHLADTEEEHVLDLCLELGPARMAWSPTHNLLAFTYDESITIFDAEMWQMHNMEFRIGDVVGWGAAG